MKSKIAVGSALAALVLLASAWIAWSATRVPRYEGKTLEDWLQFLDPGIHQVRQREQASTAIRAMGAAALPEVERILRERPTSVRLRVRNLAVRWRILKPPAMSFDERQFRAAGAAYRLAEDAGVDISILVPQLRFHFTNSSYSESMTGRALARAGSAGIACLTNLLLRGEPRVRDHSGWALALDEGVRRNPGVQEALISAAESDPDPKTRANLVLYLSHFREMADTQRVIALGCRFLASGHPNDRWVGAELMGTHVSSPEAREALQRALQDSEARVRSAASRALAPPARSPQ